MSCHGFGKTFFPDQGGDDEGGIDDIGEAEEKIDRSAVEDYGRPERNLPEVFVRRSRSRLRIDGLKTQFPGRIADDLKADGGRQNDGTAQDKPADPPAIGVHAVHLRDQPAGQDDGKPAADHDKACRFAPFTAGEPDRDQGHNRNIGHGAAYACQYIEKYQDGEAAGQAH